MAVLLATGVTSLTAGLSLHRAALVRIVPWIAALALLVGLASSVAHFASDPAHRATLPIAQPRLEPRAARGLWPLALGFLGAVPLFLVAAVARERFAPTAEE